MNCLPVPTKKQPSTTLIFISGVVVGLGAAIYLAHPPKASIIYLKSGRPDSDPSDPDAVPAVTQGVHDASGQ